MSLGELESGDYGGMAPTSTAFATAATAMMRMATETMVGRADETKESATESEITIDASFLFDWGNAPGTGPYFSSNNVDAAQQITTAALLGSIGIVVFSLLRVRWPELYSHRLRLRHMRPSNIPRTVFGWMYPLATMSDRHVLETIGLDALLFFRSYRMFIYMFISLTTFGMLILYPVNFFWGRDDPVEKDDKHTIFDSPIANVKNLSGRYSIAHAFMAYVFAGILFFYIDRFALHTITMRWHYLLLTRRSGNSRTLMATHLPRELRSEAALARFIRGMHAGEVESVHVTPMGDELNRALAHRTKVLRKLEASFVHMLGNPCRARSYDPELLKRVVLTDSPEARELEAKLLRRWARRTKLRKPVGRPQMTMMDRSGGRWWWPFVRVDCIDHWREELTRADARLQSARDGFGNGEGGTAAFVTMQQPADAYVIAQLSVHARPDTCKIRMAPEARSIAWKSIGKPYSSKMLRYVLGLIMTVALLLLWCVPVVLISTLISLRFLVTRSPGLADVVRDSQFVRSLLSYTLPSLILTIFMTILPRLLWMFVLTGGDRAFGIADKNMFIRHLYFLVIYIVIIFGMSGSVWSAIYSIFTDFGGFWSQLVNALPGMATWYCVYVMLYGVGYQVLKLLHLKSVCRFLFHQAMAHTPRDYMKAISPVFIDWGTFQPYTVLFFFVGILYSHLQPLLLPMTMLYYIVGLLVMKYMCVYAWYFRQENAGVLWPVIIRRMVVCVLLYQALTTAIFAGDDNHWFVAPMIVLMLFTWYYFWVRCKYLKRLAESVPLQMLREAERRRKLALLRERKEIMLSASAHSPLPGRVTWEDGRSEVAPVSASDSISQQQQDQLSAVAAEEVELDSQALMPKHLHPKRTRQWFLELLYNALVHPIQALISSMSYMIVYLKGDPAGPLWEHMDDYAFPERVDRISHPAGRDAVDHHLPKQQPGSILDITKSIVLGIPRAIVSIGSEFFVNFHVPRAHLDSSVFSYPRAEHTNDAFATSHRRRVQKKKAEREKEEMRQKRRTLMGGVDNEKLPSASVSGNNSDAAEDGDSLLPPAIDRAESVHQMQYCLAPAVELPLAYIPRINEPTTPRSSKLPLLTITTPITRTATSIPEVDPQTGSSNAMQYQAYNSELPFGTQMNRRYTDFSQPNMSYLSGILDTTKFRYMHPGLYGDLPSLWLPVQCLKHRTELKRTAGQRVKSAIRALEGVLEDNIIGERTAEKLHEKRKEMRKRVKDATKLTPFASRQSPRPSLDSKIQGASSLPVIVDDNSSISNVVLGNKSSSIGAPVVGEGSSLSAKPSKSLKTFEKVSDLAVQQKMDDMMVASRCSALGIDPTIVSDWDPTGLHHSYTFMNDRQTPQHLSQSDNSLSGLSLPIATDRDSLMDPPILLDESDSDYESDNQERIENSPRRNSLRGTEEGNATWKQ
ncbi:DUF221-domain-containing protein [Coemansia reversa NRRL 1564]|uniref:DUF221-domain-containing protein n=1 Tax=Coemansia reversa (strain ATCC 12441 / NRRL 1564) TaxID=763665 RepID=A0A2G5B5W4_COERN|nr:DUF221-domain-containing protein [Coemansia reversa NRRL 1564]|eukprot:PIA14380.1 DUF221-domain-containing protein [Coemansia reversa NRRL 1564]